MSCLLASTVAQQPATSGSSARPIRSGLGDLEALAPTEAEAPATGAS
jgi:hypothetical protein